MWRLIWIEFGFYTQLLASTDIDINYLLNFFFQFDKMSSNRGGVVCHDSFVSPVSDVTIFLSTGTIQ